jgi:hypothetical protein
MKELKFPLKSMTQKERVGDQWITKVWYIERDEQGNESQGIKVVLTKASEISKPRETCLAVKGKDYAVQRYSKHFSKTLNIIVDGLNS